MTEVMHLQEKRKAREAQLAGSDAEDLSEEEPQVAADSRRQEAAEDLEGMKKTMMKRKDRNLYQSILNRQKAKKEKVEQLEKRKAASSRAKKAKHDK